MQIVNHVPLTCRLSMTCHWRKMTSPLTCRWCPGSASCSISAGMSNVINVSWKWVLSRSSAGCWPSCEGALYSPFDGAAYWAMWILQQENSCRVFHKWNRTQLASKLFACNNHLKQLQLPCTYTHNVQRAHTYKALKSIASYFTCDSALYLKDLDICGAISCVMKRLHISSASSCKMSIRKHVTLHLLVRILIKLNSQWLVSVEILTFWHFSKLHVRFLRYFWTWILPNCANTRTTLEWFR